MKRFVLILLVQLCALTELMAQPTASDARREIEQRLEDLTTTIGQCPSTNPAQGPEGGFFLVCERGRVYFHPRTGVREVHGAILQEYLELGGPGENPISGIRELGYPISDELRSVDSNDPGSHFQFGSIVIDRFAVLRRIPVIFSEVLFGGRYKLLDHSDPAICKAFNPQSYLVPAGFRLELFSRCNFSRDREGRCNKDGDGLPAPIFPSPEFSLIVDASESRLRRAIIDPEIEGHVASAIVSGAPILPRSNENTPQPPSSTATHFTRSLDETGEVAATAPDDAGSRPGRALVMKKIIVVDNDEGASGKWFRDWQLVGHGPEGNLHLLVYNGDRFDEFFDDLNQTSYPTPLRHLILEGPTNREFDDGDIQEYNDLEIFDWRSPDDAITILIYESDPDAGIFTSRKHDGMFLARIERSESNGGIWLHSCSQERCERAKRKAVERALKRNGDILEMAIRETGIWPANSPLDDSLPEVFAQFSSSNRPSAFADSNRPPCPKFE